MSLNAFARGVTEQLDFYVYLLIDPRDGDVFYVGKGTDNRCFAHLAEARKTQADIVGDYPKLARIRALESAGATVWIELLRHGLSEYEALLVESVAIDLLDLQSLTNLVVGHGTAARGRISVMDINAQYGASPVTIDPEHRVVLIRISRLFERGMTAEQLYEATRKWWVVGGQRRQTGSPHAPEWALAVFGGIVRGVYRIEAWEQPPDEDSGRWGFRGTRDPDMEARYLHRDVASYLRGADTGRASQNPLRYVNCDGKQLERVTKDS